jgi:hypothetical protein
MDVQGVEPIFITIFKSSHTLAFKRGGNNHVTDLLMQVDFIRTSFKTPPKSVWMGFIVDNWLMAKKI